MRICRVALEVVGECTDEQLVEDAALVHVEIVRDFVISPGCEVSGVVVGRVETISTSQADGVRENDTGDGVRGLYIS